jgi:hypothetical protein
VSTDAQRERERPPERVIRRARQCVDELGAGAGDAWALWDELRRARTLEHAQAQEDADAVALAAGLEPALLPRLAASPEEVRALGEWVRADARVVGATRLADALAIPLSDAYDRPDGDVLPLGIAPEVARERAERGARVRAQRGGLSWEPAPASAPERAPAPGLWPAGPAGG